MQTRRSAIAVILAIGALLLAMVVFGGGGGVAASGDRTATESESGSEPDAGEADAEEEARGGQAEAEEEALETQERVEAWHGAKAAGTLRVQGQAAAAAAPGWSGEQVISATANDWEPAI